MVLPRFGVQHHLAAGNVNLDISLDVPRLPGPEEVVFAGDAWIGVGGAATNYSVAVARSGQMSSLVAVVSRDMERLGALEWLRNSGVDVSMVRVVDGPPGIVVVMRISRDSHRSMVSLRGVNTMLAELIGGALEAWSPSDTCHIHLASVHPDILDYASRLKRGCTLSYDPGGEAFRHGGALERVVSMPDWVFVNTSELRGITGSGEAVSARALIEMGARMVVVKHGRGGATLITRTECYTVNQIPDVYPVDVTGAGDAFDALFNISVKAGLPLDEALKIANAAGSAKVLRRGSSNMPGLGEIESMYRRVGEPRRC